MRELKPCPFCGAMPEILVNFDSKKLLYFVLCQNEHCPKITVATKDYQREGNAVNAWNQGRIEVK